jgi:uncharacterized membrane protein (UPF0127 family)
MHALRSLIVLTGMLLVAPAAPAQQRLVSFGKGELSIQTMAGPQKFAVEIAIDDAQREQGLMYRTRMPADAGMLFIYPQAQAVAMWMKNTLMPLDMVFISTDGRIRNIRERAVPQSLAIVPSDGPVKAALELNAGTVERLGIKPGDKVTGTGLDE